MPRLYATADGNYGVISEEHFAIIRTDELPTSELLQELQTTSPGERLDVVLTAQQVQRKLAGLSLATWSEVPETLTRLQFLAHSDATPDNLKGVLQEIYIDLRDGLGF